nr:MAG TPA: hypothetical protein [Caudoviricetes sp.]
MFGYFYRHDFKHKKIPLMNNGIVFLEMAIICRLSVFDWLSE